MDYIGRIEKDEKLVSEEQIVIYGAGMLGKKVYATLKEKGMADRVKAFCVSDPVAAGGEIEGKMVLPLEDAAFEYADAAWLVASSYVGQMAENLQKQRIQKIHIIRW